MADTEALLTRLYEAFNRKDIEAVVAGLHPEIDWPNLFGEGRIHGRDAMREMWLRQFDQINPEATPISFTVLPDGRIRVEISYVVRNLDGKLFTEERSANTYSFRDGLISGMEWG